MEKTRVQKILDPVYDYVIVGAGTTGCVLANRLSVDAFITVVILEAGGDDLERSEMVIPGSSGHWQMSKYDWSFKGVSHRNAFKGFTDEASTIPRGKVLGGSGSINYNVHMRGTPHDYDTWKNMGCRGWGYADVLPYFIKSECCLDTKLADSGYRGTSGPVMISEARFSPLGDVFVAGGQELGYRKTDCNGRDPLGFMIAQSNIGDGVRQSGSEVYLRPVSHRNNLHIATYARVTKILISEHTARGVEFSREQCLQVVRARREVIICAGSICTPQILMLSGIGPKEHLQDLKIPLVADLPVGDNLQDHLTFFGMEFEMEKPYSDPQGTAENQRLYKEIRSGPIATNVIQATALIRSKSQSPDNPNPDIHLVLINGLIDTGDVSTIRKNTAMKEEVYNAIFANPGSKHGFSINPSVTHPRSRGYIRLRDKDPSSQPVIDHRSLSHPDDLKTLIAGLKFVLKLTQTKAFQTVGAKFTKRVLPRYTYVPFTDEYWEELIRTLTHYTYHPAGTCKMGRENDPSTVVDPFLRVKGVERLRVADASIIPEIPSANLNAPCVMIGEKAADIILGRSRVNQSKL